MRTAFVAAAILAAGTTASDQMPRGVRPAASDPQVRVVVTEDNAALILREYSGVKLSLAPFVGAAAVDSAEVLFQTHLEGIDYVVVRVGGMTRRNGGSHYCGAGQEANLLWLKISGPKIIDATTVLYESCAFSIQPHELRPTTDGLTVGYDSFSEKRTFELRYDHHAPAQGFTLAAKPMPD